MSDVFQGEQTVDRSLDLTIRNWHQAEMRVTELEALLTDLLRMQTVGQNAKAKIRSALTSAYREDPK